MTGNKYNYNTKSIHVSDEIHGYLKKISYNSAKTLQHVLKDACIYYIENNHELLKRKELFVDSHRIELEVLDHDAQE